MTHADKRIVSFIIDYYKEISFTLIMVKSQRAWDGQNQLYTLI